LDSTAKRGTETKGVAMGLNVTEQPTLFIVADAFRHDYINPENTPTLCALAKEGCYIRRLRPNFGFCERTEMFTGTRPDVNGFFTALTYDDENSAFRPIRREVLLLSLFDWKTVFLRRYIRRFNRDWFRKIRKISQPVYEIPLALLPRIALTEDLRELHLPGGSSVETIFDILRQQKKSFYFDTFVSLIMDMTDDDERTERLCRTFSRQKYNLYLIYIGDGDGTGHDFGPHSEQAREMNRRVDAHIKKLADVFFNQYPAGNLLAIGDHGMLEVERHINVDAKIFRAVKKASLKLQKDFDYFLDSTLARLWFHSERAKNAFQTLFSEDTELTSLGKLLTPKLATELHIPSPGGRYGDLLWIANPGILIFPDFFHFRKPCIGMHGYETYVSGQKGFAIAVGKNIPQTEIEEAELIDICPTLCRLLNIRVPEQNCGKCLLP